MCRWLGCPAHLCQGITSSPSSESSPLRPSLSQSLRVGTRPSPFSGTSGSVSHLSSHGPAPRSSQGLSYPPPHPQAPILSHTRFPGASNVRASRVTLPLIRSSPAHWGNGAALPAARLLLGLSRPLPASPHWNASRAVGCGQQFVWLMGL